MRKCSKWRSEGEPGCHCQFFLVNDGMKLHVIILTFLMLRNRFPPTSFHFATTEQALSSTIMKETSGKRIHYKEPEGFVARLFWRLWMKFSVTFALSMMETWEIALICER